MFDYIEAVRQETANRSRSDRLAIAKAVAKRIPPVDYLAVIEQLLLPAIDACFVAERHAQLPQPAPRILAEPFIPRPVPMPNPVRTSGMGAWPSHKPPAADYEPDAEELPPLPRRSDQPKNGPITIRHQPPAPPSKPAAPSRWSGTNGHGSLYRDFLDSIVSVGGAMKRRRDCTKDDLRVIIGGHMDAAGREERLLKAMQERHARTLADLPEPVLMALLREAVCL